MKAKDNQSVFDLAVQHNGSVDSAFAIAVKNNLSVSTSLLAGQDFNDSEIVNQNTMDYFAVKSLVPATESTEVINGLSGIGFMAIEENFKVD